MLKILLVILLLYQLQIILSMLTIQIKGLGDIGIGAAVVYVLLYDKKVFALNKEEYKKK